MGDTDWSELAYVGAYEAYVNKVLSIVQSVIKVFQTAKSPRLAKEKSGVSLPIIGGPPTPCPAVGRAGGYYIPTLLYFTSGAVGSAYQDKAPPGRAGKACIK